MSLIISTFHSYFPFSVRKSINETQKDIIKCSSCAEDANATSWCVECSEFICDSCVQAHQRLKITKDHTIKPKDTAVSDTQKAAGSSKSILCHVHTQVSLLSTQNDTKGNCDFYPFE